MTIPNKYKTSPNYDTLRLKRLWQCALQQSCDEDLNQKTWKRRKRHFLFSSFKHKNSWAPVKRDSFEVIESIPWHTKLPSLQKQTPRTCHLEHVSVGAILVKQHFNSPKRDIEQRSSLKTPLSKTFFIEIIVKQARCWRVPRNAFIDFVLVHCGIIGIDNVFQTDYVFTRRDSSPKKEDWMKRKKLDKTLSRKFGGSVKLREDLVWKRGCVCSVGQDRQIAVYELHFLRDDETHAETTSRAGENHHRHGAAWQLEKDIRTDFIEARYQSRSWNRSTSSIVSGTYAR